MLIPAHNESVTIAATLDSLWGQTRPPENAIVVADNCTDDTADIARQRGADVFTTIGNREKKAGALNQALADVFPHAGRDDVTMIMDADSVIVPEFLETAMSRLEADADLIAVGGVFYGEAGRRAWWASYSATSTRATSATSPVASARCSSSRAPHRCFGRTR